MNREFLIVNGWKKFLLKLMALD